MLENSSHFIETDNLLAIHGDQFSLVVESACRGKNAFTGCVDGKGQSKSKERQKYESRKFPAYPDSDLQDSRKQGEH